LSAPVRRLRAACAPLAALVLLAQVAAGDTQPEPSAADGQAAESKRINAFFEEAWEAQIALNPEAQTYLGRRTNYDRWHDRSDEAATTEEALLRRQVAALKAGFKRESLDPQARLSYDLFLDGAERELADAPYRRHHFVFDQMNGAQADVPAFLINFHAIASVAEAEAYIARLRGIRPLSGQLIESRAHYFVHSLAPAIGSHSHNITRRNPTRIHMRHRLS
jgi:uncharacterized protein (DUF885 family)